MVLYKKEESEQTATTTDSYRYGTVQYSTVRYGTVRTHSSQDEQSAGFAKKKKERREPDDPVLVSVDIAAAAVSSSCWVWFGASAKRTICFVAA